MSERIFEFVEGTSSKFWAITVDGPAHTVRYGKIGTAGQSKAKAFASDAAAADDAAKLVAEKTGKGYVETGAGAQPAPVAAAKPKPAAKVAEPEPAKVAGPGAIERRVDLDHSDWLFASWRPRDTLPPLPPRPAIAFETKYPKAVLAEALPLFTPERFAEFLAKSPDLMVFKVVENQNELLELAHRAVLPYLSEPQRESCRAALRPLLAPNPFVGDYYERAVQDFCYRVGALLGMPAEMAAVVASPQAMAANSDSFWDPLTARIAFGLGSASEVSAAIRRIARPLTRLQVRAWLATTLWHELDYVTASILEALNDDAERLTRELGRCLAPETAPEMLRISLGTRATAVSRKWLHEHPALAVAGLVPVAQGASKLAKAAVEFLRELRRKGHGDAIERDVSAHPELRAAVFEDAADKFAELAASALPEDLREALATPGKPLGWVDVAGLPAIVVGGGRLGEKPVTALLNAIKSLKEASLPAAVVAVRRHAEPRSLDAFAWALFEAWQREGMPTKEKWAFAAMGHLGGDASALKLTPLIREWPGQSKHQTAVMGLKVLCGIGSDTALMSLNGVAQKVKFAGVKKAAQETMEQIASARGMSRAELEDRIVPDLGLDARGGRDLDFGPRQFRVLLDGQLNPVVREADGKPRGELPKPNTKDDAAKADAAVAEWKLLKKQLKEVIKLQSPRLEAAMVTMRRWPVADFEALIVRHPLMTNFARRLVWGGFDKAGKYLRSFRVTEELDYTRADDKPTDLAGFARVGIVHPMQLDAAERGAWGQLFADYELVPPFTQLGRPVFEVPAAEKAAKALTRFASAKLNGAMLWGAMGNLGWERGSSDNHGIVMEFSKFFPAASVTAVVEIEPGIARGVLGMLGETQSITRAFFLPGHYAPASYPHHKSEEFVPWGQADGIAASEVLSDLTRLAAKAE